MLYKKSSILLLLIVCVASIFRFYNIHDWLFFGMDQEYEAFLVQNILSLKHIPLIGVNAGDTGLYLGPLFIYFASIPYALFQGNPLGGAVLASLLGLTTVGCLYIACKEWWGEKVGLIASFLYASSFLASLYDRQFWNPTPLPLGTVLLLYFLTKTVRKNPVYLVFSAFCLGFLLQSHLQAILLLAVSAGFIVYYRQKLTKKYIGLFIGIIIVFQIPLVAFDIRHNFTNTKAFVKLTQSFITDGKKAIKTTVQQRYSVLSSFFGRALYAASPVDLYVENGQCEKLIPFRGQTNLAAILLVLISLGYFLYQLKDRKKRTPESMLLAGIIAITCFGLALYSRRVYEYYFLYMLPVVYICISYTISSILKKHTIVILGILAVFILVNTHTLLTATMTYSFQNKLDAIKFAAQHTKNEEYKLEAIGGCGQYGGYRYLFEYFGNTPNKSYMDQHFSWIYGEPQNEVVNRTVVIGLLDERENESISDWKKREREYKDRILEASKFGNIGILVIQNE